MTEGPYRAEHWVLIAPHITGENRKPAGVVHFDEQGYLSLVQCPHISWGMEINEVLAVLNARDTLHNDSPEISSNFFAQTNTLVQRYDQIFPKVLKRRLLKEYDIEVLKYQHTEEGTLARDLLDNFDHSAHQYSED